MNERTASERCDTQATELDGLTFEFRESLAGHLGVGEANPDAGEKRGRDEGAAMRFDLRIRVADLGLFLRLQNHPAELEGTVTFGPLGGTFPIRDGRFCLFTLDPASGARQITYSFRFTAADGFTYFLRGHKQIVHQPGQLDAVEGMTTLFTTVYGGEDDHAPVYGAGRLYFKLADGPALAASIEVHGAKCWRQKLVASTAFASFVYGTLRDEYLRHLRLFYDTSYQNLVLAGRLRPVPDGTGLRPVPGGTGLRHSSGAEAAFFFVSGTHERDFPWGDGESFSDVLLAIDDGKGEWHRFAITERALAGLELDVATGLFRYRGPLYALREGYTASFTEMSREASPVTASPDGPESAPHSAEAPGAGETPALPGLDTPRFENDPVTPSPVPLRGTPSPPRGRGRCFDNPHASGCTQSIARGVKDEGGASSGVQGASRLVEWAADFAISFDARPYPAVNAEYPLAPELVRKMSSHLARSLEDELPGEHPLGIFITPHSVEVKSGRLRIFRPAGAAPSPGAEPCTVWYGAEKPAAAEEWTISRDRTFGEAERGTFHNIKEPTALYGYLCAVRPNERASRVQIHSGVLRHEREHWAKDQLEAFLGTVIRRTSSSEMLMENGTLHVRRLELARDHAPGYLAAALCALEHWLAGNELPAAHNGDAPLLRKLGSPVLEVANDQFPTGVFLRRIVEVLDPSGVRCLALEEDMSLMRLSALHSDRQTRVASIRDDDKFCALDRVLDTTGFDSELESKLAAAAKTRPEFAIAIKPNFMFAYNREDHSTYTDPELVHHLVRRLLRRGFRRVFVVEAQSTLGQYFDHRSVREVATYLGYDESVGFRLVDMTEDAVDSEYLGPHLGMHPFSRVWKNADFRISFAKNKTHPYANYTLTLKNIYGALPLANKFKEYHCKRGIYLSALEYLQAFPVDYGLIDAYLSADGPFGVFADPAPRETRTVIGGPDLVAVDWVGASKMGIDPLLSPYMKHAVEMFGKPEIHLVGDSNPYRPWLNVPAALTLFANRDVDADYHFGNAMYSACAETDDTYFHYKNHALYMRLLRALTNPLRRTFFLRTGENPTWANRFFSRLFYKMGF